MEELFKQIDQLLDQINKVIKQLDIDDQKNKLDALINKSQQADFWNNNIDAQTTMKSISKLEKQINPWLELQKVAKELKELSIISDKDLEKDILLQTKKVSQKYDELKKDLLYQGQYDNYDVILSIYAGAGGTDAQDWTQMLFRMYSRYSEKAGFEFNLLDESTGEEAGLKSVTVEISGPHAFGKLKGEQGVHRLVRLSPFNSDNLRQTSFAKVDILPKIDQPDELTIDEKDLKIDVYRSGGKGGQGVNTTDSAVRITHIPTGISVAIQNERSQVQNKEIALTIIRSKLAQLQLEQHQDKISQLKGPNQSAEWGNQIRNYVLHPYKQVKDLRTKLESSEPEDVLNGDLAKFINAYTEYSLSNIN